MYGSRHKYVCAIDIRIEIATRCVIRNLLPCREGRLVLVGVGVSAAICMCHTTPMFVQALCTLLCDCTHSVALCVCLPVNGMSTCLGLQRGRRACLPCFVAYLYGSELLGSLSAGLLVRLFVRPPACLPGIMLSHRRCF